MSQEPTLSWTAKHDPGPSAGLPNSRRLRPRQLDAFRRSVHAVVLEQLFTPGSRAAQLWDLGLLSRLPSDGTISSRKAGQLALIEKPEALEGRARVQTEAIERGLTSNDRTELQALVLPERWQGEAKARVMAKRNVDDYIQAMNEACSEGLVRQ